MTPLETMVVCLERAPEQELRVCSSHPVEKHLIDNKPATHKDDNSFNGTRKLIRPQLPPSERRRDPTHGEDPLTMTFVLEDGEELRGVIEWYDKCVVKLRVGRSRVMVYKAAVKYLYKTSDAKTPRVVMK